MLRSVSPLLAALLRALILLAVIEALVERLPSPLPADPSGAVARAFEAVSRAGDFVFVPAFGLAAFSLAVLALSILRKPHWPPGPNGFIAVSLLCLVGMSLAAFGPAGGPLLALGFTTLSFIALCAIAMQGFAAEGAPATRAFGVAYASAIACSFLGQAVRLAGPAVPGLSWLSPATAWRAGEILLAAAAVLAFLAWFEPARSPAGRLALRFLAALAALITVVFVWTGMPGARGGPAVTGFGEIAWHALLAATLFLATLTALSAMLDPERRVRGVGVLLLLLAGFPLRIAYQQILMVLGAALLYLPPPIPRRPIYIPEVAALPEEPARFEEPSVRT